MRYNVVIVLFCMLLLGCSKDPFEWSGNADISIMSFNLRYDTEEDGNNKWGNRKEACINMLIKNKPSVIGIQEGRQHQVDFLADHLLNYAWVGVKSEEGDFGEYKAIFYNKEQFELIKSNTFWLSPTPTVSSIGWDANNIRSVTWAHLRDKTSNNKSIFVFNTHLDHIGHTSRVESVKLLLKKIQEIAINGAPIFITGDFNTLIRNEALSPLIKQFYCAKRFAKYTDNKNSFNFFGRWYLSRNIDFIFYKNAKALAFRTITTDFGVPFISDHYPLISHLNY